MRAMRLADAPLSEGELQRLLALTARLPLAWTASGRRRRLLVLALAAPGFLLVASTPLHKVFALLLLGAVLFVAALLFRGSTEPLFTRAEAAGLWPPSPPFPESPHA